MTNLNDTNWDRKTTEVNRFGHTTKITYTYQDGSQAVDASPRCVCEPCRTNRIYDNMTVPTR